MNIVEKEFVSFEVALEMKKLNFDEPCLAAYRIEFTKGVASGFLLLGKDPSHLPEPEIPLIRYNSFIILFIVYYFN